MIKGVSHNRITSNKYIVRFAQNEEEVKAAQRLRFEVFNLELGEGLAESYYDRLDTDDYDEQCHHLLVIERDTEDVIGTYRMQTYEQAERANGFYTACEYDLSSVPDSVIGKSVEVGRACIAKNHRNGRVLYLLWRGLAEYMSHMEKRYLFGCCSITSQDPGEAWKVMSYLKHNKLVHPEIAVDTTPPFRCDQVEVDKDAWKTVELPQLFRLYISFSARVCSPPALDRDFKTIDYLVIMDIEQLDERARLLFFK